jgi:hypothetical protein
VVLIARIHEVFPLLYPKCGGQMRIIPLSRTAQTFGKCWSTSGWTASRRCGMNLRAP